MLNNVASPSGHSSSARPLITDVTTHRAPSLDGFQHFRFYCSNFAVKYLLIIADILVITYTGELMFNIMICNITKIRIRLSICTSSEVVLSSICSLRRSRDGTVFVRSYVTLAPFSSLWPAFTLTVHINALYNESVHRQEQHTIA